MGKLIEHTSIHGTDLSDDGNAEAMMKMPVNLPAVVITHGVSKIHEEDHGIQKCFIIIQNQFVQATVDLSRLVTKTAKQRPPTLKDSQKLAIDEQSRLLELRKFQAFGSLQHEIAKKFCGLQIRE